MDNICKTVGEWYAASFEPHHHKLAIGEIAYRGLVPYLPIEPRRERHGRGALRTVWRPMLGSYVFVRCRATDWHIVNACRGMRRFLTGPGVDRITTFPASQDKDAHCREVQREQAAQIQQHQNHPILIDDAQIEVIRLVETEKAEAEGVRQRQAAAEALAKAGGRSGMTWDFSEGERVRIKSGPFAGFYAQLTAAVDERDRIAALIKMFGRKTVTVLSAFEIERTR